MGCGISRLDRHVKERGMHDNYTDEDDMKEKERLGRVEKVKERTKGEKQLPHAHAAATKGGRQYYRGGGDFCDDDRDQMLSDGSDREDSFINCPRSPSFRDYCIDDDSDDEDRHHTPKKFFISVDHDDHINDHAASSAEYRNTNKVISDGDELVKKESKGRSPGKIRGALSRGRQSKRIKSYLNVSNWHHHNNPISPSQSPQKMVAAGN